MEYENKSIVDYYEFLNRKMGLWDSEKYVFNKYVAKSSKILDLGCGNGRTTFGLYAIGYRNIIGLDISREMIDSCKRKCRNRKIKDIEFVCSNAENLEYESESFDCVFFSFCGLMTINRESKRMQVLQEISRVLKKGGLFIFTTYDREKNTEYFEYWKNEETKWENNSQNKKYEKFGDRICQTSLNGKFIHVPIYKEVKEMCNSYDLRILWSKLRSDICQEKESILSLSDDCIFYVAQKRKRRLNK